MTQHDSCASALAPRLSPRRGAPYFEIILAVQPVLGERLGAPSKRGLPEKIYKMRAQDFKNARAREERETIGRFFPPAPAPALCLGGLNPRAFDLKGRAAPGQ